MKVFSLDGSVYNILNRIADFLILSILYVICCIPVITIGGATTALYYASIKSIRQEGYAVSNFFKAFKANFKQATLIWLPSIIFFGVIISNIVFVYPNVETNPVSQVIFILNVTLLMVCGFLYSLVFPLLSRFDNSIPRTLTNGFILSARYLPWALMGALIHYLPLLLIFFFPMFTIYIVVFWCLIGFALCAYGAGFIYEKKIFIHFMD